MQVGEHATCGAVLVLHQPEQQVLGADVGVIEQPRLLERARDRVARRPRERGAARRSARRRSATRHASDGRLHRREIDRGAGDHVGRDLEHAEQQVLGRDDVLRPRSTFLQSRLEDRDVLPAGDARTLGALEQAGQALLHDPAVGDADACAT